jgi:hypothetical protein
MDNHNLSVGLRQQTTTQTKTLRCVFSRFAENPLAFPFTHWNWKSALMSGLVRGTLYLVAASRGALHQGVQAAAVELLYIAATAGFFAAIQQEMLDTEPQWLANLVIVLAVPLGSQTTDYLVHSLARTPNLKIATLSTLIFSLLSASFHLHVMQNGAMLVGKHGRSFASDMKRMPRLIATFAAQPVLWVLRWSRGFTAVNDADPA